ncbi:MAG: hypothetical protein CMM58_08600 [Rhodospirillaceae bacterium]|nr:hypothetical protein [Rhodospirillaceae bacterium]
MSVLKKVSLHPDFGTKVFGIDLRNKLDPEIIAYVKTWIDEFSLVVFPGQHLDDDSQLSFTKLLGEPEPNHVSLGRDGIINYFGTIGNVQPDGSVNGNSHEQTQFLTGNNMWHSDSSFRKIPSFVSIMSVYEVPDEGGYTQFVSSRSAYSRLPSGVRQRIDPLEVIHDYVFSRSKVAKVEPSHAASLPPVIHKLVRKNPNNGFKNYYVGSHARSIAGWEEEKSRLLLDDLLERATRTKYIYTQKWEPGDLVIWDNRCLLHRGTGYDADKYRRFMRQTRVCGVSPNLEE